MWFQRINSWVSVKAFLFSKLTQIGLFRRDGEPSAQISNSPETYIPAPQPIKASYYKPVLDRIVLVEEENLIRWKWEQVAIQLGLPLTTYAGWEEFLRDLSQFTESTKFFLDQDMYGVRKVGSKVARAIRANPATKDAYICLVTSYSPSNFREDVQAGVISEVRGKFPYPFQEFTGEDMIDFRNEGFLLNFANEPRRPVKRASVISASSGEMSVIESVGDLTRGKELMPRHARIRAFETPKLGHARRENLNRAVENMQLQVTERLDSVSGSDL